MDALDELVTFALKYAHGKIDKMNYLTVENISKSYGERTLFDNLSFGINKDQKIAFVAKNGTGKTSILKIMTGEDMPDTGQVIVRKDIKMAFLSQEPNLQPELTIEESIFASDNDILKVIEQYEKALENPEDEEAYQKAFENMERHNAWDFETQYKQILFKLKLEDLKLKVKSLSGGQKKRLALAIILINRPDLLILDEPTNHLDLEVRQALNDALSAFEGAIVVVSHDRHLLRNTLDEFWLVADGKVSPFDGDLDDYHQWLIAERKAADEPAADLIGIGANPRFHGIQGVAKLKFARLGIE